MDSLKESFEDVADWCEKHLEDKRGREIGMTFGVMLRAYGRLASLPSRLYGEQRAAKEQALNAKAEGLLLKLSTRFLVAYGWVGEKMKLVEAIPMRTNMTYDTGPTPLEIRSDENAQQHSRSTRETAMNQPRFEIVQEDMGGWVRVFLGRGEPTGEVAKFLSHGLTDWMRKRPHLRVRLIVPISRDGDTVEFHAWYDQVLFPNKSPMADPESGGSVS